MRKGVGLKVVTSVSLEAKDPQTSRGEKEWYSCLPGQGQARVVIYKTSDSDSKAKV